MMKRIIPLLLILMGFTHFFPLQGQMTPEKIEGIWLGGLSSRGSTLRVVFRFSYGDGTLTGVMDSPDQDITGIKMDEITLGNDSINLKVPAIRATFGGILEKVKVDRLNGIWSQAGQQFEMILEKVDSVPQNTRPQEPRPPYPYASEEVTFSNDSAGIELAGTLTLPEGNGPFPAVILISGSGPQDRDESLMGHKPFLVIADHLTRNGIAVLRYDDRGFGKSTGNFAVATTRDFATDASAAVDFLLSREEIDPKKIGLAGHSEGGMVAPMVVSSREDIGFIVLLAGPGTTGEQILLEQAALIARAEGASEEVISLTRRYQETIFPILKSDLTTAKARKKADKAAKKFLKKEDESLLESAGFTEETIKMGLGVMVRPWYRSFLRFDPGKYLPKVSCPVLALNGSKDLQVPPKSNLEAIEKHLTEGGNKDFMIRELPDLNHLFQTCETGALSEYKQIEETFNPIALRLITDWIKEKTK